MRRALELGLNERYVFGDPELRAFRERLAPFRSVVADVELNREVLLRVRWNEPARAPLHAALRRGPPPRFEVGLVYALGR